MSENAELHQMLELVDQFNSTGSIIAPKKGHPRPSPAEVGAEIALALAHPINSFVGAIEANLALIESRVSPEDDNGRAALAALRGEAQKTRQRIRAILAPVRSPSFEWLDLKDTIYEVLEATSSHRPDSILPPIVSIPDGLGTVWMDREQLSSIFENLVTNSYYALAGRRGQATRGLLKISATLGGDSRVEVAFQDNGPGFDKRILKRVFAQPVPTKSNNRNGVGLWLAKHLLALAGGDIWLSISSPAGACVVVALVVQNEKNSS